MRGRAPFRPWAAVFLAGLTVAAAPGRAGSPAERDRFMPLGEVRPGMRGFGTTVFSAQGPETFDVEIIDVLKKVGPNRNIILARLEGAVVDQAGIIQGMSGSPVYIDGRLVGAVAYGWAFSKEPIAGITPIEEMLSILEAPEPPEELTGIGAPPGLGSGARLAGEASFTDLSSGLRPIRVPVLASGLAPEAIRLVSGQLASFGMDVVQGAGSGSLADSAARPIAAGDPVSIPLVRGDASVAVFGTVTYSDGERLVAFGHPVFQFGGERLPMAGGAVIGVLPSQYQSFKFASAAEPVGFVYADRATGVAGRFGDPPAMLPLEVTLESPEGVRVFRYEVVRHRFLTTPLVQAMAFNTLVSSLYRSGFGTVATDVAVHLNDGTVVRHRDLLATVSAPEVLASQAATPLAALIDNPFADPGIARIELRSRVEADVRFAALQEVRVLDQPVRPGDRMRIELTLQAYRGESTREVIEVAVPATAAPGALTLKVCDEVSYEEWDRERAPEKYRPRSYDEVLDALRRLPRHNRIVATLFRPGTALIVDGRELRDLPPSVERALTQIRVAGARTTADGLVLVSEVREMNEHVVGCQTLTVQLEER